MAQRWILATEGAGPLAAILAAVTVATAAQEAPRNVPSEWYTTETTVVGCLRTVSATLPVRGFALEGAATIDDTARVSGDGLQMASLSTHSWRHPQGLYSLVAQAGTPIGGLVVHDRFNSGFDAQAIAAASWPAREVWVPGVFRRGALDSVLAVQNADLAAPNHVAVEVVPREGWGAPGPLNPNRVSFDLAPGQSVLVDLALDTEWRDLGDDFTGSAHVTGDRVVAVEHEVDAGTGIASTSGLGPREVGPDLVAPMVVLGASFRGDTPVLDSNIALVNAEPVAADVTVRYTGSRETCTGQTWTEQARVPPGGTMMIGRTFGSIPAGCIASAAIHASGNVAAVVYTSRSHSSISDGGEPLAAYEAVPVSSAGTEFLWPWYHKEHGAVTTAVAFSNAGATPAHVRLQLRQANRDGTTTDVPCSECSWELAPGTGRALLLDDLVEVPSQTAGSLYVSSDVPILGVGVDFPISEQRDLTAARMCTPHEESARPADLWVPVAAADDGLHNWLRQFLPAAHTARP